MSKLIFFSYNLHIGGMEKALVELLNELSDRGNDITLVLEKKEGELLGDLRKDICVKEYRVSSSRFVLLRKVINFIHRYGWIMLHKGKYDFSCAYATYSVIGTRLALAASAHSSLYVHSNYYELYKGEIHKIRAFFDELSLEKFKNVIFVSNESMEGICRIYPSIKERGRVINNLMDAERVKKLSECDITVEFEQGNVCNFLFVGRLEEESKRLTRLIRSFSLACAEDKGLRLYIIGDGKDRALCEQLISENGMESYIRMLGKKENPYPYMKKADCILLTSDYEGYPVIYNECLILKKPLITTIPVADGQINISDYAMIAEKDDHSIASMILNTASAMESVSDMAEKKAVDFKSVNLSRINQIEQLIHESEGEE